MVYKSALGLQTFERWKDMLGLVHKSGNWVSWLSALKILYIHLPFTVNRVRASVLSLGNMSTKEKNPGQTVNVKKLTQGM